MENYDMWVGRKFTKWTVIEHLGTRFTGICKRNNSKETKLTVRYFLCRCECGNTKEVTAGNLVHGKSRGCTECKASKIIRNNPSEYRAFHSMRERCFNVNSKKYKDYGGRGITICNRWLESFEKFFDDMGKRPEGLTLERINNDGNYEPSNCRWATWKEQNNNRRNNVIPNLYAGLF